uniref:Carbam_trans_N domain-containing protein n=1 Tax=Panagrellus redivivus TaxID=6233 RepID=A0A7E4WAS8_PANRE
MSCGVYLALSFKNKTLGAAFYDEAQAYAYYMPDVFEDEAYKQLRMLIDDVRPTNVIASCAQDAGFLNSSTDLQLQRPKCHEIRRIRR